ncbi:MAG: DUF2294 domain-containing protein [Actinomycetota bacterium]|nr:DUF2294 domain-containing protein [Actinomycetota bacterium]
MNEQASSDGQVKDRPDSVHAEISRAMVRLYKDQFGRGPTKVRTDFAGPDVLLCTLEHSLTPAERSLAAMGEHQRLRDTRLFFQHATEDEFRGVVERILGRKVRGFISGLDTTQDISVELFYLEPQQGAHGKAQNGSTSASQPDAPQV